MLWKDQGLGGSGFDGEGLGAIPDGVQLASRLAEGFLVDGTRAPFHIHPALFGAICYFRSSFHSS